MGVSASGKSTIAAALAVRMGWRFLDADDFHPPGNVAKMRTGVPLTDADRLPWLDDIRRELEGIAASGASAALACSALKKSYRDILRSVAAPVRVVYLRATKDQLVERIVDRGAHFFSPALLDSQFAALEEPLETEDVFALSAVLPAETILDRIAPPLVAS
jgi:gluconokinase